MKGRIVAISIVIVLGVVGYLMKDLKNAEFSIIPTRENIVIDNAMFRFDQEGQERWMLGSRAVIVNEATGVSELRGVSVELPSERLRASARGGVHTMNTGVLELEGDVVVNGPGYSMKTDRAVYDPKTRSMASNSGVLIEGRGIKATGARMAIKGERIEVKGGVRAEITR